ncbi:MAG: WhiB family transcriptional regulator [Acidimicrobiales bacterium]
MAVRDDSRYRLAACQGRPTALFFPEPVFRKRGRPDPAAVAEAKEVCAVCPVRERCLAVGQREEHGIWGGLTGGERRAARRARQGEAA